MNTLIFPTVHMNGTSALDLLEQHTKAMRAVSDAIEALPQPNGRDYYPQSSTAVYEATEQMMRWGRVLEVVRKEIEAVVMNIHDQSPC